MGSASQRLRTVIRRVLDEILDFVDSRSNDKYILHYGFMTWGVPLSWGRASGMQVACDKPKDTLNPNYAHYISFPDEVNCRACRRTKLWQDDLLEFELGFEGDKVAWLKEKAKR